MCECELFTSEDGRNKIADEIRSFKKEEFIYAALPFGAWSFLPDPQKMIIENKNHADLDRFTKYKVNHSLHSKYLIGHKKIIWGSGNMTETSIYNKHETYEIIRKNCHPEKYEKIFSEFQKIWERSTAIKPKTKVKQ